VWTGELRLWPVVLTKPLRRKKPTPIFVCSMGDLAHEDMPVDWFRQVWEVMVEADRRGLGHAFQVLTPSAPPTSPA
jgi:protein gp37